MAVSKQVAGFVLSITLAIGAGGCDSSSSSGGGASMEQLASASSAQRAAEQQKQEEAERQEAERKAQEAARPREPQIETVTSHSPKKGRTLEGGGYLSVVAGTRFWAEHQIILNNILHATRLWQAEHGRYPKTQEEFMREIIEPNEPATSLPELPEGWEYYYDPATPLELKMINRGGGSPNAIQ
jgi:hypothetical protein